MIVNFSDILTAVVGTLIVSGLTATIVSLRKVARIPKDIHIIKAAMFRLLNANKVQGDALIVTMTKVANGDGISAAQAVKKEQENIDNFLRRASLGIPHSDKKDGD
jgi:hypothetical protein